MRGYVTYTARDGTVFDLTDHTDGDGTADWGSDLSKWELSVNDTTGKGTRKPVGSDVDVLMPVRSAALFTQACYSDALNGGGVLAVGGWSRGVTASVGTTQRLQGGHVLVSLTLYSVDPLWRRTTTHTLMPETADSTETTGLDLPTDIPFDLAGTSVASGMESFAASAPFLVRATFFGPCQAPYVSVTSTDADGASTSNRYGVSASAGAGERVVIDPLGIRTVGGSVYRVGTYGERTNLFDSRLRGVEGSGTYVFQRMPAGTVVAAWPQSFGVTLELIEERGSLPWT